MNARPLHETLDAVEEAASRWVARRHDAGWSDADQRELDAWLDAATGHRVAWLRMKRAWERSAPLAALPLPPHLAAPPSRRWQRPWRIAAAVALAIGFGLGGIGYLQFAADRASTYQTARGDRREVRLADGSVLLLDTDTRLRAKVDAASRTVWLDRGEAFFDIAHDAAHPFVVDAGDRRVTVLGTRFSVRREAGATTVLVLDGRVRVDDAEGASATALLAPGGRYVAAAGRVETTVQDPARIADALAWRDGKVVFDQTTLADAAAQFNRYNARQIVVADAATARIRIGGRFDLGNMPAFVRLLHQGFGVGVREAGSQIFLSSPGGGI